MVHHRREAPADVGCETSHGVRQDVQVDESLALVAQAAVGVDVVGEVGSICEGQEKNFMTSPKFSILRKPA